MVCLLAGMLVHAQPDVAGASMSGGGISGHGAERLDGTPPLGDGFLLAVGGSCKEPFDRVTATARPMPQTGVYRSYTNQEHVAPFSVTVRPGQHFFVKLEHSRLRDPVVEMFVQAGETFRMDVPVGTYRLKYGFGTRWYGFGACFGDESTGATYNTSDELLIFEVTESVSGNTVTTQFSGNSVTLYAVPYGNFETRPIPRRDF